MDENKYEFRDQKIVEVEMNKEVQTSFIQYAMSVIVSRALPDVRDGLKPVHRRILYAMYEDHLTYDKPFRKSATTVGNVLGRYHPHGDSAVYDAMVRLAQPFSLRYPLIEGHGNFGNVDGDEAAAYRYTEARMSKMADLMLSDIEKEVVDFIPNFDNKLREPTVLPSRFPNLLVNGSVGIAVGMATNIPPHNMREVIDGTVALLDDPEISIADLMTYIKGPDFPTGAMIYGTNGIVEAYNTGRGRVYMRSRAEIDEDKHQIVFTEIPYMVNKSMIMEQIALCNKDGRIDGITDARDESGRAGLRVVVDCKRDANMQVILNQLYKYTQLQETFPINFLAIVNGEPKTLNLKQILVHYVDHQESVIRRRVSFDLAKAENEAHIREGQKIAIDNIDEVINIIRHSASIPDAKAQLMERFGLTDIQAQAIVEMTLGRLSGLERKKIEDRLNELYAMIAEYKDILANEYRIKDIIREELLETKKRFGDERRTELVPAEDDIMLEDLIERHTCVITMTHTGYVKRIRSDNYTAQNRGGKGLIGMATKEEDFVEKVMAVDSHSYLMMFTDRGKVYMRKAYQIPECSRTAKGSNIINIIEIESGEKVTAMLSVPEFSDEELYLTMVTKLGVVKRTPLAEYEYQRKGGKRALTLDEGDELLFVAMTTGNDELLIATHDGNAVRFHEKAARSMGRTARGVRGIKLCEGDFVVGVTTVEEGKSLITVTENGFGKRCEFEEFSAHNRGTKGVTCQKISEKTGKLCGVSTVSDDDDLMLITNTGTIIRTPVAGIPSYSRSAGGVIIMRLSKDKGMVINSFAKVAHEEHEEEEIEEIIEGESEEPRAEE